MVELTQFMWLGVSMLYLFASIYFHVRYQDELPRSVILAYFTFGASILFTVNTGPGDIPYLQPREVEYIAMLMLIVAWGFGVWSVRTYVRTVIGAYDPLQEE